MRRASPQGMTSNVGDVRDLASADGSGQRRPIQRSSSTWPPNRWCGRSYADPVATYSTNVMGTVNVLEAAAQALRTCAPS